MPTSHPRHSITETPELAAVLGPLRRRLGDDTPSLGELVQFGAEAKLAEVEAQDRARAARLRTFVDRMAAGPQPDLREADAIRRAVRAR